jgi:CubicO group peptidase (beta-lactamase class C family)
MTITRRSWLGMASALAVGTAAAATRRPALPPTISIRHRGARDPAPLLAALANYAAAEVRAFGLPGLTMAVVGPDGLDAAITLGYSDLERGLPVRADQLFQIGSISKSLVALCLYRLASEGKLDLDALAASILPDVPWPDARITVAMLLDHSAALADGAPVFPRSPDGRLWTNYAVGKHFSYSNTGFDLLGLIVAKASGMPFHRALKTLVLDPLGMAHAEPLILTRDRARYPVGYREFGAGAFFPDSPLAPGPWLDIETAAGSVAATPADMARYIGFLIRVGRGQGAPIMSDALAKRWSTPMIDAAAFGPKARYAAGMAIVEIDGRSLFHHTGGMILFHSSITVDPQAGVGVFASTNSGAGGYRPRGITNFGYRLLRAWAEGKPLPAPPAIVAVPPIEHGADYAGRFLAAGGDSLVLTAAGTGLHVTADGVAGRLMPAGKGRFAADHPRLARHEIAFVGDRHDHLWWGGTLYGRDKAIETPAAPAGIRGLAGLYVNDSPWAGSLSIVTRGDDLVLEGQGRLTRASDGSWRAADEPMSAERLWFEGMLDGTAQRLVGSGTDYRRFHDMGN